MLGCGEYKVFLQMRGGGGRIEIPTGMVPFSRVLNEMGAVTARVPVTGEIADSCCQALNSLRAWRHELAIHRDGVEVWSGPVIRPVWSADSVEIAAKDITQWFERRWLPHDRNMTDDLGAIFNQIVSDAMEMDPSPNISCVAGETGIIGTRSWLASEFRRAADELRELSRTGIDYATIGHIIHIGGIELRQNPLPELHNGILDDIVIVEEGQQTSSQTAVLGYEDVSGVAGTGSEDIGLVQNVWSEATIKDATTAVISATSHQLGSLHPDFITARLLPEAPVKFEQLIPGVRVPVNFVVGCKMVRETLRLNKVDVSFVSDQNADEIVKIELVPLGATGES